MANWDRTADAAANAAKAAGEFARAMLELLTAAVEDITDNIYPLAAGIVNLVNQYAEDSAAFLWAETHRPEWVRIHGRTKKKRTRKKYRDRIVRAYREAVQ